MQVLMAEVCAQATICNRKGLHARAAAKFVKVCENFEAKIWVRREGEQEVSGHSILGLMMLAADTGTVLYFRGEGSDASAAVAALVRLVESRFEESE